MQKEEGRMKNEGWIALVWQTAPPRMPLLPPE